LLWGPAFSFLCLLCWHYLALSNETSTIIHSWLRK
jgi:hypothetical protein